MWSRISNSPDETGTPRKLSDWLASGPVVLFFYPAAMTPGCTMESCHFRDLAQEFADVGAARVGISRDQVSKQQQFADKYGLGYPLLSDADGQVARQFGVRRSLAVGPLVTRRMTFVIGTDRRVPGRSSTARSAWTRTRTWALQALRAHAAGLTPARAHGVRRTRPGDAYAAQQARLSKPGSASRAQQ